MPFHAEDAHAVAVGAALAMIAQQPNHPHSDPVLHWIVQADRDMRANTNRGAVLQPWRPVGTELMARVLAAMDPHLLPGTRLRYASASPRPRLATLTDAHIRDRARMVPATLWPSWTMRMLPNRTAAFNAVVKPEGIRAALSAMLLLPGTTITYRRAVDLLGGHAATASATAIRSIMGTLDEAHLQPLLSGLAQLAAALDTNGSPIDYARRRAVFAAAPPGIDRDAYERLCARQGWPRASQRRLRLLDRYLLALLTGTDHRAAPADPTRPRDRTWAAWSRLRYRMPAELREFLHDQALVSLAAQHIDEPVGWEPPAHWVTGVTWAGVDPDHVDQQRVRTHAASGASVRQMARAVSMSTEHVRLYAEITGITVPEQHPRTRPPRTAHQGPLAPDRLRELYEQQRLSITRIAELAGCGRRVVAGALRLAGIQPRPAGRQRTLQITREWLKEQYVDRQRTIADIALELGTSRPRVTSYAEEWGITLRPSGYVPDPLAKVSHHERPSPEVRAAFAGHAALKRIRRIVQLPGHPSITAGRTASHARPPGAGTTRSSATRRVRRPSGTGWSCPMPLPGGAGARPRTCWSGRWPARAGGGACSPEAEDLPHLIEALDQVSRRLGGVTRRWRFDRMATVCTPSTGRLSGAFAAVAKHYSVAVDVCPPRHGNRKGVVEKANHAAAQRWWRTVPDEVTIVGAQASLDRLCGRLDGRRRRHDGIATTVGALADAEDLGPLPPVAFPAELVVDRQVSAQGLVAFRGNQYSVGPGLAGASVRVRVRLGDPTVAVVTAAGVVIACHHRAPDGAGALVRDPAHVAALEGAVLAAFADRPPCRHKTRRPPSPAAQAEAARLLRGADPAAEAAWTLPQLQDLLDEWVICWQNRPHDGLRNPYLPGRTLSPNEAYTAAVARAGHLPVVLSGADRGRSSVTGQGSDERRDDAARGLTVTIGRPSRAAREGP